MPLFFFYKAVLFSCIMVSMEKKPRVVVAMSGGVDSSVAAALLKGQGFEVVGITMCFNLSDPSGKRPGCCGIQGIEDARRVASLIGIRHYVINMKRVFEEKVIRDFCDEYAAGRTPNPCVRCNQFVKFDVLLKKARALGAAYLATGHYARIKSHKVTRSKGHQYSLLKAMDRTKDQSYFLYRLTQAQLAHLLFPLGGLTKARVRELAKRYALPVAEKPDSQEICFVPELDYRAFLRARNAGACEPGPILDTQARVVGRHRGIAFYTIGQRQGLGIALGFPAYVVRIDATTNQITVGRLEEAKAAGCLVRQVQYIRIPPQKKVALQVRIRYNHKEAKAIVTPMADKARVEFRTPQFAVTPGQSAVFYHRDEVVGGGIID